MKLQFLLFCLFSVTFAADISSNELFIKWKFLYKKVYNTIEKEAEALINWNANRKKIAIHNLYYGKGERSYNLELNHFADLNGTEFTNMMNGYRNDMRIKRKPGNAYLMLENVPDLPKSVDWREKGFVTPVKNQGQCGSCWSFSATGSLEGQHFRKTNNLVSLSEQNLIDCSVPEGNQGCNGGLMDQAFRYIKLNNGIDTEAYYPYMAQDGVCRFNKKDVGATDKGYVDIPSGDETALKQAVATVGPISVAIDASHQSFQFYSSGVYNEPECSSSLLDHGVLVVGYGTQDGQDYWLVKNSWGESWGDKGYIRMSRNRNNQCGIATQASYPTV